MQKAFSKAIVALKERIQDNPNPDIRDVANLGRIYAVLPKDSSERKTIEDVCIDNFNEIRQSKPKEDNQAIRSDVQQCRTFLRAVREAHLDDYSMEDIKKLAQDYDTAIKANDPQQRILESRLGFAMNRIYDKLLNDFEDISQEDTKKMQTIFNALPPKDESRSVYNEIVAPLQGFLALKNDGSIEELFSALQELDRSGAYEYRSRSPFASALEEKLQEKQKVLDDEAFKNLPEEPAELSETELQSLLDSTSADDMERYAKAYADGYQKRGFGANSWIGDQLNAIALAIGNKYRDGTQGISDEDVKKLQVFVDNVGEYADKYTPGYSLQVKTAARFSALKALKGAQDAPQNLADNLNKLLGARNNLYEVRNHSRNEDDPFDKAVLKGIESNAERMCQKFQGNFKEISLEDVQALISSQKILSLQSHSGIDKTVQQVFQTNKAALQKKFGTTEKWSSISEKIGDIIQYGW